MKNRKGKIFILYLGIVILVILIFISSPKPYGTLLVELTLNSYEPAPSVANNVGVFRYRPYFLGKYRQEIRITPIDVNVIDFTVVKDKLVFVCNAENWIGICQVGLDGTNYERLITYEELGMDPMEWIIQDFFPDGRLLFYHRDIENLESFGDLIAVDYRIQHKEVILRLQTSISDTAISPNGKALAVILDSNKVYLIDLISHEMDYFTEGNLIKWSDDSQSILVAISGFRSVIFRVFSLSEGRVVKERMLDETCLYGSNITASPDLSKVIYFHLCGESGDRGLVFLDLESKQVKKHILLDLMNKIESISNPFLLP